MQRHCATVCLIFALFLTTPAFAIQTSHQPDQISLDFHRIPVRDVLQLLAQIRGLNLMINDAVNGDITLHVDNLPWQQALNLILQAQGLGQQSIGNVLLIAPLATLTQQQAQQFQLQQEMQNLAPLQSMVIPLHYGKAQDIATLLKSQNNGMLSPRGNISADQRTNRLWIEDTPIKLAELKNLISQIDIPVHQVIIEARIVNIDEKYEQELGVRFGLTRPNNHLSGTIAGANALANGENPASIDPLNRLNVDLPAVTPDASSLGLALAKLGGGTLLDLELSALETEGGGEIISSPRLMTANQQPATILSGQEIPYQAATSSGATNISFQKAVLSLTVTPQITPENNIMLNLQVNQDRPSTTLVQGVPSIETRQIQTQVLVENGQTIVLGGIYEQSKENQVDRIPFLSSLPVIGHLFSHSLVQKNRQELLIFITPHVAES